MNVACVRTLVFLGLLIGWHTNGNEFDEVYDDICDDKQRQPTIIVKTTSIQNRDDFINIQYGENLTVFCSTSNALNLTIQDGQECLPTKQLNSTTIQLDIETPNIGMYTYTCIDSNACEDSFSVTVSTQISVGSAGARHTLDAEGDGVYFIPPGEVYEVMCSGNDVKLLQLKTSTGKLLQTDTLNKTTLVYRTQTNQLNDRYQCAGRDSRIEVITWTKTATVVIDFFPEANKLQCALYHLRNLECSWGSSSKRNTFRLFYSRSTSDPFKSFYTYLDINKTPFLCAYSSGGMTGSCTWNNNFKGRQLIGLQDEFSLLLQTCNDVFCNNQTFPMYSNTIIKLDPVSNLKLLSANSRGAVVTWDSPDLKVKIWEYEYKVQFRLLAMEWQQVNMSSLQCSRKACGIQLALPCPASHYELQVFAKLVEATDKRLWSRPSSLFFFSKPSNPGDVIDPVCNTDVEEPEPLPTVDNVLYKIRRLVKFERQQNMALKKKINTLKEKIAKVKELMEFSSEFRSPA